MSDDLETVEFKIQFSSTWHNEPPSYEILIDDESIESGQVSELESNKEIKSVSFSKELPEGEHELKIRLLNKKPKHTEVDDSGNILSDQLLWIKEVEIDEIELEWLAYFNSRFYKQIGTKGGKPIYEDEPLPEKLNVIGLNGEWRLTISVPTYMWFLENL